MNKEIEKNYVLDCFISVFNSLVMSYRKRLNAQGNYHNSKEDQEGSYHFIPRSPTDVVRKFVKLRDLLVKSSSWSGWSYNGVKTTKFLDAGCGIGNIMVLAKAADLCTEQHGIEYYQKTFNMAKEFLSNFSVWNSYGDIYKYFKMHKADIMKYSKYSDYDIIYYYHPFSNHALEAKFEERVEDEMQVGAVLIPMMKGSHMIDKDKRFKKLPSDRSEPSYIKIADGPRDKNLTTNFGDQGLPHPSHQKLIEEKYGYICRNGGKKLDSIRGKSRKAIS